MPCRIMRKFRQKINLGSLILLCKFFLKNRSFWPPDNVFWWKSSVLQVSGRTTFENVYKITSKSKFSTHFVQIPYHLHSAFCNSLKIIILTFSLLNKKTVLDQEDPSSFWFHYGFVLKGVSFLIFVFVVKLETRFSEKWFLGLLIKYARRPSEN